MPSIIVGITWAPIIVMKHELRCQHRRVHPKRVPLSLRLIVAVSRAHNKLLVVGQQWLSFMRLVAQSES